MRYFFDTSALVARWNHKDAFHDFACEAYYQRVEESLGYFGISNMVVSSLVRYELTEVLSKLQLDSTIPAVELNSIQVIKVVKQTLLDAAELLEKYGSGNDKIGSFDAIHLAIVLSEKKKDANIQLVCTDKRLIKAAEKEAVEIIHPYVRGYTNGNQEK